MATITPTFSAAASNAVPAKALEWLLAATANTHTAYAVPGSVAAVASIQFDGTWGGATAVLKGSNDGTTYFQLKDVLGNNISATSNNYFEFSTAARFIQPVVSGGTGDSINIRVSFKGPLNA